MRRDLRVFHRKLVAQGEPCALRPWPWAAPQRRSHRPCDVALDDPWGARLCLRALRKPRDGIGGNIAPSVRFVIPRATSSGGVRYPRVCLTRHLPSLGFLNPSTACSSADLPVLFHTGAACGIQRTRAVPDRIVKRCRGRPPRAERPDEQAVRSTWLLERVVCEDDPPLRRGIRQAHRHHPKMAG